MKHKEKVDLKATDELGRTALHIAARYDYDKVAKLMVRPQLD